MQPRLMAPENPSPLAIAPPQPWYQRPSLDRASQAYINELMYGDEAQTLFRDQGEQAYVDHINQGLLNAYGLARFALQQPQRPADQVSAAPGHRMAAPTRRTGTGASAAPAATAHTADSSPFRPGEAPPLRDPDIVRRERERRLNDATLRYAGLIAMRRASHGDVLLEQQRRRGHAAQVLARVFGAVLNPAEIGDYNQAKRLARQSNDAAEEYRQRANEYIAAEARTHDANVGVRHYLMDRFETAVQEQAREQTMPHKRQDGTRYRSRWDNLRVRLTDAWFNGGKVRRAAIVAPGAVVTGAAVGVGVGLVSLPAVGVGVALFGTLLAGRSIGGAIASTVNRFQAAHLPLHQRHAEQAQSRNRAHASYLRTQLTPTMDQLDITRVYESATTARAWENLQRKRRAELVGTVAAGAAFGISAWATSSLKSALYESSEHYATPGATPTPEHVTPTPTPNTPPPVNVHDYPWNVAHQLQPGHEWNLINNSMQQYNTAYGTHLHLVEHANGTPWTWIENGARALNPAQQTMFNQFMHSVAHAP